MEDYQQMIPFGTDWLPNGVCEGGGYGPLRQRAPRHALEGWRLIWTSGGAAVGSTAGTRHGSKDSTRVKDQPKAGRDYWRLMQMKATAIDGCADIGSQAQRTRDRTGPSRAGS